MEIQLFDDICLVELRGDLPVQSVASFCNCARICGAKLTGATASAAR